MERKIYDSIYAEAKRDYEQLNARGLVSRNYTHILAMLMRYGIDLHELRRSLIRRVACVAQFYIPVLYCLTMKLTVSLGQEKLTLIISSSSSQKRTMRRGTILEVTPTRETC